MQTNDSVLPDNTARQSITFARHPAISVASEISVENVLLMR